jgi:hypothetical protein
MVKGKRSSTGGRGSAEAIEKRRVARQLNALFGADGENGKRDGRTEKRRQRLLKELKEGRAGKPLKPIEVITHADELLSLGETLSTIRKNGVRTSRSDTNFSGAQLEAVRRAQSAYGFRPEVWKLLGVDVDKGADETRAKRRRNQRA